MMDLKQKILTHSLVQLLLRMMDVRSFVTVVSIHNHEHNIAVTTAKTLRADDAQRSKSYQIKSSWITVAFVATQIFHHTHQGQILIPCLVRNASSALNHVNNMRTPGDHTHAAQNRHYVASHAYSPKDMTAGTIATSMTGMALLQQKVLIYNRTGRAQKHTLLACAQMVVRTVFRTPWASHLRYRSLLYR